MRVNWKNVLERAAWTFLEGFLVALPTTVTVGMDGAAWKSAFVGAAMAGISAVKTLLIEVLHSEKTEG